MVNNSLKNYINEEIYRMAYSKSWEMIALKEEGVPVQHEFFIVNVEPCQSEDHFEEKIQTINRRKLMGPGYQLEFHEQPSLGFRVKVKAGWSLQGEVQSRLWLQRFTELIGAS